MKEYDAIQQIFKVLADANRLRIIESLTKECTSVNEIAKKAGISQPLASHHLKILKEAGIARVERHASFNFYCMIDSRIWDMILQCEEVVKGIEKPKCECVE